VATVNDNLNAIGQGQIAPQLQAQRAGAAGDEKANWLSKMAKWSPALAMYQNMKQGGNPLTGPGLATYNAWQNNPKGSPGNPGAAGAPYSGPMGGSTNPMAPLVFSGNPQSSSEYWWGAPEKSYMFPQFNGPQQEGFQFALQNALQNLGNNQFDFAPIEEQARTNFAQQTIPSIATRFSALGAQKSSAFGQQLGAAGANLERDLAAMKANYNLQRQPLFQNLLQLGLTPQYQSVFAPATQGFFGGLAQNAAPTALKLGTMYATGGLG